VVAGQQFVGRGLAGLHGFLQRVQEVGLVGQQAAGAGAGAGLQPGLGDGHDLARQIVHLHAVGVGLQPVDAGGDAQRLARVGVPAFARSQAASSAVWS
jgi:hypothetical protein